MTDPMSTKLGSKWWFAGLLGFLSALLVLPLLRAAGLGPPQNWAQWAVNFLCFGAIWRCLGFAVWFAVVLIAPSSKLLDRAGR